MNPFLLRMIEKLLRIVLLDNTSIVHKDDPICNTICKTHMLSGCVQFLKILIQTNN